MFNKNQKPILEASSEENKESQNPYHYKEFWLSYFLLRFYLLCFLLKIAVAIPLKKLRKRKINVFLRGSCFG